jgi:hypothetical protein
MRHVEESRVCVVQRESGVDRLNDIPHRAKAEIEIFPCLHFFFLGGFLVSFSSFTSSQSAHHDTFDSNMFLCYILCFATWSCTIYSHGQGGL